MSDDRPLRLASADRSDKGLVRHNNEDLAVHEPARGIYGVIDGVGGQSAGELAAAIARRAILQYLERPGDTPVRRVREAIAVASNEIAHAAQEKPEYAGMACVLTLALVVDRTVTIGHVGDTRCYRIRPGHIRKLTSDHSPVGEKEDAGELRELEAMNHPRRNEVFRDIGSAEHHAAEDGFLDIVEDTIEDECALLFCSDGLTDGVASWIVYELVKQHAGNPQAVVDALVAAANEAGGRDNVTVVYVEGQAFASALHAQTDSGMMVAETDDVPTLARGPADVPVTAASTTLQDDTTAEEEAPQPGTGRGILERRTTWLAVGLVGGVAATLLLISAIGITREEPRRLVVGGYGPGALRSIQQAMDIARPGDVVVVEEGTYREDVVVKEGVDLVASRPGRVTLIGDGKAARSAITANGPGRISGLRVVSTSDAPFAFGVVVAGPDRHLELLDLDGPMDVAIRVENAQRTSIYGCTVNSSGTAVRLESTTEARLANNTFINPKGNAKYALLADDARETGIIRNTFVGYGAHFIEGTFRRPSTNERLNASDLLTLVRRDVIEDNFVIPLPAAATR